jgi:hypothetical protein
MLPRPRWLFRRLGLGDTDAVAPAPGSKPLDSTKRCSVSGCDGAIPFRVLAERPFRLDEGLYFDNEDLLIAWGTALESAALPGEPEIVRHDEMGCRFDWRRRRVLGLVGDVAVFDLSGATAPFIVNEKDILSHFGSNLGQFQVSIPVTAPDGRLLPERRENAEAIGQLRAFMKRLHDHLSQSLGAASSSTPGVFFGLPSIHWQVMVGNRPVHLSCRPAGELEVWVEVALHLESSSPELDGQEPLVMPFVAWDLDDMRMPQQMRAEMQRFAAYELDRREGMWGRRSG